MRRTIGWLLLAGLASGCAGASVAQHSDALMTETLIINGERLSASDNGTFDVFDPSSGEKLATVAKATKSDVDRAVVAAHRAMDSKDWGGIVWAHVPIPLRRLRGHHLDSRIGNLSRVSQLDH